MFDVFSAAIGPNCQSRSLGGGAGCPGRGKAPIPFDMDALFAAPDGSDDAADDVPGFGDADSGVPCPRCEETDAIALEKLRSHFNTCYRCRLCGHIFSPAVFKRAS